MDTDKSLARTPPAGGYGGGPPSSRFRPEAHEADGPRRSLTPFITVGLIVACVSSLLVTAVVGLRHYIAAAKTAEVRNAVAQIAKDAAAAHERTHRVCPSASQAVPADERAISARKYQSQHAEWRVDEARDAGFACLGYEMVGIQYFQYGYEATPSSFTARGRGDLNGDGVFSDFTWGGRVEGDRLVIARSVTAKDGDE